MRLQDFWFLKCLLLASHWIPSQETSFIELSTFSSRLLGARACSLANGKTQSSVCSQDQGSFVPKVNTNLRSGLGIGSELCLGRVKAGSWPVARSGLYGGWDMTFQLPGDTHFLCAVQRFMDLDSPLPPLISGLASEQIKPMVTGQWVIQLARPWTSLGGKLVSSLKYTRLQTFPVLSGFACSPSTFVGELPRFWEQLSENKGYYPYFMGKEN